MESPFFAIAEFTYDWESWISPEGHLRWVNPAVERITGYSVAECMALADYPLPLVVPADRPAVEDILALARRGETGNHFEFRVQRKDGEVRWAAISWQPITVAGQDVGFRSSVRDIHERKQMEEQLQAAVQRAEEANHQKTQFLANVTHELRTPLQSILGYAQLLMAAKLPEPLHGYVDVLRQQSEHLEHLVSELLDFSALQAGMLPLRVERFEPTRVLEGVLRGLEPLAQSKQLSLSWQLDLPETMCGDPRRVAQVLTNLVGNAIEYTPAGEVRVVARRRLGVSADAVTAGSTPSDPGETMNEGDAVCVHVDDTGPGLPAGEQLFEPFVQGRHERRTERIGGVGLGLALSRQLCVRMGGSLSAGTSPLGGARLSVVLPRVAPGTSRAVAHFQDVPSPISLEPDFAERHALRILVVDDVDAAREFLAAALRALGYEPSTAASADEAFELVEREPFDTLLVDIQMPEVDGWTTARGLRARLGSAPYLVALTAQSTADDAKRLTEAGFDGYATKPISLAGLQSLLTQAHAHQQKRSTARALFDQRRWDEMARIPAGPGRTLLDQMRVRVAAALPAVLQRIEAALNTPQQPGPLASALHDASGLFGLIGASSAHELAARCERAVQDTSLTTGERTCVTEQHAAAIAELLELGQEVLLELKAQRR